VTATSSTVSAFFPINPPKQITINYIFSDNHNWDVYRYQHRDELRSVEIAEVEKMLSCAKRGYCLFECSGCGEVMVVHFGCNSRVCTHCGKRFTDKWAESIARKLFDVKHRHVVLTIPEELRLVFYEDRILLKVLMDCAIAAITYVMAWKLNYIAVPGIVVVLHTYGKDMKFNPHLHCLVTEGGFKGNGTWVDLHYFPFRMVRTSWQYQLLTCLKEELEDTFENVELIDFLFNRYPEGFYIRAKDTINNKKKMIKYIGRYIRHPAVAESRIIFYDGGKVVFWYEYDNHVRHYVMMSVNDFIHAVIDHVPDKQFKTIRHYGVYSRGIKRRFKRLLGLVSIAQTKLLKFNELWSPICPKCGKKMDFVLSGEGEPPPRLKFGERIGDWNYISASVSRQ